MKHSKYIGFLVFVNIFTSCEKSDKTYVNLNQDNDQLILKELRDFISDTKECEQCNYIMYVDMISDLETRIKMVAVNGVSGEFLPSESPLLFLKIDNKEIGIITGIETIFNNGQEIAFETNSDVYMASRCFVLNGHTLQEDVNGCNVFFELPQRPDREMSLE